jgi:hypothetical protein
MHRFSEALEVYQKFMDLSSEEQFGRQRELAAEAIKRLETPQR